MTLLRDDPHAMPCVLCLEVDSCSIRLDRRGRPYLACTSCGSHVFPRGRAALIGPAVLGDAVRRIAEAVRSDPQAAADLHAQVTAWLDTLRARLAPVRPVAERSDLAAAPGRRVEVA